MKKLNFLSLLGLFFVLSCAGSKNIVNSEKLMRGSWQVQSTSIQGIDESHVKIKVLDDANLNCFNGSIWKLVQNNHTGSYTLSNNECTSTTSNIIWHLSETNGTTYFNFKRVYPGEKPKNVLDGYKLRVVSISENSMTLSQDLMFESKPISTVYTFTKNQ